MSVTGKRIIGMPTLLLYEAEGCTILVQTRDGSLYRGRLEDVEDNWNLHMMSVVMRKKGSKADIPLNKLFIRGANVSFIVIPDQFKDSPMFQRVLEFKKGNTAPNVKTDTTTRPIRGNVGKKSWR